MAYIDKSKQRAYLKRYHTINKERRNERERQRYLKKKLGLSGVSDRKFDLRRLMKAYPVGQVVNLGLPVRQVEYE